jgi:hypothetical protein
MDGGCQVHDDTVVPPASAGHHDHLVFDQFVPLLLPRNPGKELFRHNSRCGRRLHSRQNNIGSRNDNLWDQTSSERTGGFNTLHNSAPN